jgi:hypothetical protein
MAEAFSMSREQSMLEQIELCSKRMQNLIIEYGIETQDLDAFLFSMKPLQAIAQEAAEKIQAIDKTTGQASPGEHAMEGVHTSI